MSRLDLAVLAGTRRAASSSSNEGAPARRQGMTGKQAKRERRRIRTHARHAGAAA